MAELDTASIVLIVLAVLIAPIVLPAVFRVFRTEKRAQEEHIDLCDRTDF